MSMLFLDTNIVLDLVSPRYPFTGFAQKIFSRSQRLKIELFVSSIIMHPASAKGRYFWTEVF